MGNVTPLHPGGTVSDELPLIKPGEYDLALVRWQTIYLSQFGKAPKLVLIFRVVEMGEAFGTHLEMWFNVSRIIGKAGSGGKFKAGPKSRLYRSMCRLFDRPMRLDRLPMGELRKMVVVGKVTTVTHDGRQNEIPGAARYSVVSELLRAKE